VRVSVGYSQSRLCLVVISLIKIGCSSGNRRGTVAKETDKELVRRVKKGDKQAFDLLFSRYQHKIINLVGRYLRDPEDIQDVAQEAFIKAFRALPGFRGESAFYTWLYRIAINTAKNHIVARGRRPPGSDLDVEDAEFMDGSEALRESESPDALLARDELSAAINAAIADLPEDLRSAVTLREFDGLSYEQIAQIMECPVGTVRSRIFRAREAIDRAIEPLLSGRDRV
jgi:RNA polymerase sigma-70 factor (ECF subfamily)